MRQEYIQPVILARARKGLTTDPAALADLTEEYGREQDLIRRELAVAAREADVHDREKELEEFGADDPYNMIQDLRAWEANLRSREARLKPGVLQRVRSRLAIGQHEQGKVVER